MFFIEPAMFPKRIVFTLNRLYADIDGHNNRALNASLDKDVDALVKNIWKAKQLLFPKRTGTFFRIWG